jgi:hypothetical protein
MTEDEVGSMLVPIRDMLRADGYEMAVSMQDGAVAVSVIATETACAECLVPNDLMTDIVRDTLIEGTGGAFDGPVLVTQPSATTSGGGH